MKIRCPGEDSNSSDFFYRFKAVESHPSSLPANLPAIDCLLKRTFTSSAAGNKQSSGSVRTRSYKCVFVVLAFPRYQSSFLLEVSQGNQRPATLASTTKARMS